VRYSTTSIHLKGEFDNCIFYDCFSRIFPQIRSDKRTLLKIFSQISEVPAEVHRLNHGGSLELTRPYLEAMERSLPDADFRYAVLYKGGKPVLFGYFQLFTVSSSNFTFDSTGGFKRRMVNLLLELKKLKVLILGNALRNETCCFCYDRAEMDQTEAVTLVASLAEQIAHDECAIGLILKDIPSDPRSEEWLLDQKFSAPWPDRIMELAIRPEWSTMDDYLVDLSRKYKQRATKILAASASLKRRTLDEAEAMHYSDTMDALFSEVLRSQKFQLTTPGKGHFSDLKKNYGERFEITGIFDGDKMVAFFSAFDFHDTYEMYYVGFDYALNAERQLYFNILFGGLERAMTLKKKFLNLGRTSFDAKASMGATAVERKYYFKAPGVPDRLVGWFASYFSALEDGKWKLRNPLKSQETVNTPLLS
jgi:hypothetical protein